MSEPFVGEIQAFPFPFASEGFNNAWLPCFGQIVPIQRFTALYSLIGTYYGGNGQSNFALPNLSGSVVMSQGQGQGLSQRDIGEVVGSQMVTLTADNMARHTHGLQLGIKSAQNATPGPGTSSNLTAIDPQFSGFLSLPGNTTLSPNALAPNGQGQPHDNSQPTQVLIWCIAYAGVFPSFS